MQNSKFGIVFSGGGGKGAYEIGIWQALTELGYDKGIVAVAGTSVGALNGALFVNGDLSKAVEIWENLTEHDLFKFSPKLFVNSIPGGLKLTNFAAGVINTLGEQFGCFSRARLRSLVREIVCDSSFPKTDRDFYVCALRHPDGDSGYTSVQMKMNGLSGEEVANWLLASSAIPLAYPPVEIDDQLYSDGGIDCLEIVGQPSNNFPWQKLITEVGCTHIICVHLTRDESLLAAQKKYAGTKFINIVPTRPFVWGAFAPLNFKHNVLLDSMKRGYEDAIAIFRNFQDFQKHEEKFQSHAADFDRKKEEQTHFQEEIANTVHGDLPQDEYDLYKSITDQERKLINGRIESFAEQCANNSSRFQDAALMAITSLAATEGSINSRREEGFFKRAWHAITGAGVRQEMDINMGQNQAIYATQQMVKMLSERFALTYEQISELQSRLNFVHQTLNVTLALAKLTSEEQKRQKSQFDLFKSETTQKLELAENKLQKLEKKTDLLEWCMALPMELKSYDSIPAKVLFAARGFTDRCSEGWNRQTENAFISQLTQALPAQAQLSVQELANFIGEKAPDSHELLNTANEDDHSSPLWTALSHPQDIGEWQGRGLPVTARVPASNLATELIHAIRRHIIQAKDDVRPQIGKIIEEIKSLAKNDCNEIISKLDGLQEELANFRLVIPVIGKFSAGKSSLLNALLGAQVLACDQSPTTAVATELVYGEKDHAVGFALDDGNEIPIQLNGLSNPAWIPPKELLYIRCTLNNNVLKSYNKLMFVDMPGFESGKFSHEKAIARYIEKSHVFLAAISADAPFDSSSLNRIFIEANKLRKKPLHCILTKYDHVTEENLEDITKTLQGFLIKMGAAESSRLVKTYVDDNERDIGELQDLLQDILASYDDHVRDVFLPKLDELLSALRGQFNNELNTADATAAELKEKRKEIENDIRNVNKQFSFACSQFKNTVCTRVSEQMPRQLENSLRNSVGSLLSAAERHDSNAVEGMVRPVCQSILHSIFSSAEAELKTQLSQIQLQLPANSSLEGLSFSLPMLEKGGMNWTGTIVTSVVTGILLGPAAGLLGGVISGFLSGHGAKNRARERNIQLIENEVIPQIVSTVMLKVNDYIEKQCGNIVTKLQETLNSQIEERKKPLEEYDNKLIENKKADDARKTELTQRIVQVNQLKTAMKSI